MLKIEVQILIPTFDNNNAVFPAPHHARFEDELTALFGGFSLIPGVVAGAWKDDTGQVYPDQLRIYASGRWKAIRRDGVGGFCIRGTGILAGVSNPTPTEGSGSARTRSMGGPPVGRPANKETPAGMPVPRIQKTIPGHSFGYFSTCRSPYVVGIPGLIASGDALRAAATFAKTHYTQLAIYVRYLNVSETL